jgi:hypothetical protein
VGGSVRDQILGTVLALVWRDCRNVCQGNLYVKVDLKWNDAYKAAYVQNQTTCWIALTIAMPREIWKRQVTEVADIP